MEKNFVARISAIISNFERNVRKAQRLAKISIPDEIETDITANTSKFQRGLMRAKAMAQRFRKHTVDIDADTSKFRRAMLTMQRGWAQTQKAQDEFDRTMMSMAQSIRSFGTVFSNQIKGTLIASFQGLIPIIAGLVPAIMAVGNALKVVNGGALALAGAVAIAAGGFVGFGAMAFTAINLVGDGTLKATKETRRYESALQGVKDAWVDIVSDNYTKVFSAMANGMNAVKVALKGIAPFLAGVAKGMDKASESLLQWTKSSRVAKAFFNMMETTGVSVFNKMLSAAGKFGDGLINVFTQLAPLFQWSANWLDRIATNFSKWANSASGQNSIKQFMEYTKQNLPLIGKIFGNTFAAINNLMKAFGSNSTNIFEALAEMTQKFRDWSETVGKSEGFKKFVDYVQQNGPKIMDLIGNLTMLLVNFGTAMAPIASKILDVVNAIISFTSNLFEAHPGVAKLVGIMTILGGILLAVVPTIAQVAIFVKDLLIPFISWANRVGLVNKAMGLLKNVFSKLLSPMSLLRTGFTAIAGALGAISAPVWIVIGVLTALVGLFVYLWKTNEEFRNAVTTAWEAIKNAIMTVVGVVVSFVMELWGQLTTWWSENQTLIYTAAQTAWNNLVTIITTVMNILLPIIQAGWTAISTVIQIAWELIKGIVQIGLTFILGLIKTIMQIITGDWEGAWNTIKETGATIWGIIQQTATNIWNIILGFLQNIWNQIVSVATTAWNNVKETVVNAVMNAYNGVVNWVTQMWSTIQSKFSEIVSTVRDKMVKFYNTIKDKVTEALETVKGFASDFASAGKDLVMGFVNGIREKIGEAVSAAREMASGAIAAVRGALNSHSPSRVLMSIGNDTVNGFVIGIEKLTPKAINASKHLGMAVVDNFNADLVPNVDTSLMRNNVSSAVGNIDGYIDSDVRHSIAENSKPVVNLHVHNESDLPAIKSWIDDASSKENNTFNF
ncbi:phage tail protein [Mammaliicoccus sciuri]|uniref:phage tail protein n=1 Tax=Mammaliicoccus sciuri TaxID=1296 RepID=UPI0034DD2C22